MPNQTNIGIRPTLIQILLLHRYGIKRDPLNNYHLMNKWYNKWDGWWKKCGCLTTGMGNLNEGLLKEQETIVKNQEVADSWYEKLKKQLRNMVTVQTSLQEGYQALWQVFFWRRSLIRWGAIEVGCHITSQLFLFSFFWFSLSAFVVCIISVLFLFDCYAWWTEILGT